MKLTIDISKSSYEGLKKPTSEYNQWSYRTGDAVLTETQFSIELSDFPIFWQQFLESLPFLRKSLRSAFLDALREISIENVGPTFKKITEILT